MKKVFKNLEKIDAKNLDAKYGSVEEKYNITEVNSNLILSPIYGKSISDIIEGDIIMVSNIANDKHKNQNKNSHCTIPALVIKKIDQNDKKITLAIQIEGGIYSIIKSRNNVKVQLYDDIKYIEEVDKRKNYLISAIVIILAVAIFTLSAITICFAINT